MSVLVVAATRAEAAHVPAGLPLVVTGLGKTAAAAATARALAGMPDPGNPRSVGREHVDRWQQQGLVHWLGHVEDMPALLWTVDVMALPSYYREGVPRSLLEGAACGLALVTTDLPGCREIVPRHGIDGLHAEPRDPRSLARQLANLDDDRELLRTLGDNARRNVVAQFDEHQVIAETIAVYAELFDGLRAAHPVAP